MKLTVSANLQTTNKLVNEVADDSTQVSGQDRKVPPAVVTNHIAGFGGFPPLARLEKINSAYSSRVHKRFTLIAELRRAKCASSSNMGYNRY